jgi:hypothetical protein
LLVARGKAAALRAFAALEYEAKWKAWELPAPAEAKALLGE